MKYLICLLALLSLSAHADTCPLLEGKYPHCKSEAGDISGETTVEQYLKDNVTYYQVYFKDDTTGDNWDESIRADGTLESRKEKIPGVPVLVRIDSRSNCVNNIVTTNAELYFLGQKVGKFTGQIYMENNVLYTLVDGSYLGQPLKRRVLCTQD